MRLALEDFVVTICNLPKISVANKALSEMKVSKKYYDKL